MPQNSRPLSFQRAGRQRSRCFVQLVAQAAYHARAQPTSALVCLAVTGGRHKPIA
jgi:hypothetical protein